MRTTKVPVVGVLLGLSLLAACRGGSNANPDGSVGPGSDTGTTGQIHIQDVQSDTMAPGTAVELHGVVVTAFDTFGAKARQDMWVEEPDGGERSGVHVFFNPPLPDTVSFAAGDVVDITAATKSEFALSSDTSGRTTTELQFAKNAPLTVTKTGTRAVPAPHIIDAAMLDAMPKADRDAEYEKWEGVLVQIQNVRPRSYPQGFGNKPYPDDAYKVAVSDNLIVESTQLNFVGVDGLACFASIIGVEDYFFDWLLLPRTSGDVVTGTGCPTLTTTPSTITDIQAALPATAVELNDVYVTGVSSSKTSFWISTSPTAAVNQGGFVFQSATTLVIDPAIVPGVKVKVVGTVTEFNDDTLGGALTEVAPLRITVVDSNPVALTPITGVTVAALLDMTNAPTYESVLVTLDNVKITAVGDAAHGFVATAVQGTTTFGIGTDVLQLKVADFACYKTVTGFWTNLEAASTTATTKPNAYGFIVRDLGTKDGTCPP